MKHLFLVAALVLFSAATHDSVAADCGRLPTEAPNIPDGASASRDEMDKAIAELRSYAEAVNAHLNCLQDSRDVEFFRMNRAQQGAWVDSFNAKADHLTALEAAMNCQIRVFNGKECDGSIEDRIALLINLSGHLCAEVRRYASLADGRIEVLCIEYRGGFGEVRYIADLDSGVVFRAD